LVVVGRGSKIIPVTLAPAEVRLLKEYVASGRFLSESDVLRQGLKNLSLKTHSGKTAVDRRLEQAYRASSKRDRKLANDWSQLPDAWPDE
jgi:Arc/MetJ-type ribon-helix-helix transcriptional regulator